MNKLLLLLLFPFFVFSQIPETSDSIYWSGDYCDTAETTEEILNQWIWNNELKDCIQPDSSILNNLLPALWLTDTYECCCQVSSLPGSNAAMTGFWNSPCQKYLDNINFYYMTVNENNLNIRVGIYIDMYGRKNKKPPRGLSVTNKIKYFRL